MAVRKNGIGVYLKEKEKKLQLSHTCLYYSCIYFYFYFGRRRLLSITKGGYSIAESTFFSKQLKQGHLFVT